MPAPDLSATVSVVRGFDADGPALIRIELVNGGDRERTPIFGVIDITNDLTLYYVVRTHPFFGGSMEQSWFHISPISSGVFGVPLGFLTIALVSLATRPPPREIQELVDYVRYPRLTTDDADALADALAERKSPTA